MPNIKFNSEAEWLALRDAHIGGSDIASLFNIWSNKDGDELILHLYEAPPEGFFFVQCLSPYKSSFRIWHEKAGLMKPDFQETERVTAGNFMEPALAAWACQKFDVKLQKVHRYIEHGEVPGWGASLDYEVVETGKPPAEFKNVDWLIFRDKWTKDDDGDITPPFHINLQLQCQIGVTTADHGWLFVCVGGNQLERVRVPRHEPTVARIREAIELFWQGVAAGAVPMWLAEYDTASKLACDSVDSMLPAVDLSADPAACRDLRRYERWNDHAKFIKVQLDMMKARVIMKMTDRTKAETDTHKVTCPIVVRAAKMQPEKWIEEGKWRGGFTVREKN